MGKNVSPVQLERSSATRPSYVNALMDSDGSGMDVPTSLSARMERHGTYIHILVNALSVQHGTEPSAQASRTASTAKS